MGNPHAIFWVDDVNAYDLERFGPLLENHPIFPERANITLAHIVDRDHITIRTWERGAGLTRACGSAACATAVAARAAEARRTARVEITLPGGKLCIEWRERDDHVLMTGHGRPSNTKAVSIRRCSPASPELMSVDVVTFGCRLNAFEAEVIAPRGGARRALRDTIVINSCAVTNEAVAQARQSIRKLKRERPRCAHRRHRLRGADAGATCSPRWPRSIASSAMTTRCAAAAWRDAHARGGSISAPSEKIAVSRHHGGAGRWRRI